MDQNLADGATDEFTIRFELLVAFKNFCFISKYVYIKKMYKIFS